MGPSCGPFWSPNPLLHQVDRVERCPALLMLVAKPLITLPSGACHICTSTQERHFRFCGYRLNGVCKGADNSKMMPLDSIPTRWETAKRFLLQIEDISFEGQEITLHHSRIPLTARNRFQGGNYLCPWGDLVSF